jgi:hypothetical protein
VLELGGLLHGEESNKGAYATAPVTSGGAAATVPVTSVGFVTPGLKLKVIFIYPPSFIKIKVNVQIEVCPIYIKTIQLYKLLYTF